jgi:hypothetical protein
MGLFSTDKEIFKNLKKNYKNCLLIFSANIFSFFKKERLGYLGAFKVKSQMRELIIDWFFAYGALIYQEETVSE